MAFTYFEDFINRIILDNCSTDDNAFASILAGICSLKDFKKIIYRNNAFDMKSLEKIKILLNRKLPYQLEELRIENCAIEPIVTRDLTNYLT